jgi:hypothetical protein
LRGEQEIFREQQVRKFILKLSYKKLVFSDTEWKLSRNSIAREGIGHPAAVVGYSLKFTSVLMWYVFSFALHSWTYI